MSYDWTSLISPGINLGMKALGDAIVPDPALQNARTNSQNSQVDRELALWKAANAQKLRQQALPGIYTNLGYSPAQGQSMASSYGSSPAPSGLGGGSSSGGGLGSTLGKAGASVGIGMAPSLIGGALKGGTSTAALNAAGWTADAAPAAGHGVLGAVGGFLTNPITIGAGAALAAGLIWKHSQAHPTADKWVQGEQNPFDQHWKMLQNSGLPPDQLKQAQTQSAQNYLNTLAQFAQGGGHNMEVARNAARTFRQFYGDPMRYGIQLPF